MQHDFQFVPKSEWLPVRKQLEELIHLVQDEVRDCFTFSFTYVGSSSRNMITYDRKSNIGYDFDVNIHVNDDDENYTAKEIRDILRIAFTKHMAKFGYKHCEDSTRVLTIKDVDPFLSRICHSCDFCIVYDCSDGRQQYIHFNKEQRTYNWQYLPVSNKALEEKAEWIVKNGKKEELEDIYLYKKNKNTNPDKRSRSLYAESVSEIYQIYHK